MPHGAERSSGFARIRFRCPRSHTPTGVAARPPTPRLRREPLALVILAVALALTAGGCGQKPVASVNGEPITRDEFYQRVLSFTRGTQPNGAAGMQILEAMINDRLLLAEAKRENAVPTDAELDQRLNEIRTQMQQQGANLEQQLQQAGLNLDAIRQDLRVSLAQEKLLTKGITVTEQEVRKFYDDNKARQFSSPAQVEIRHMTVASEKAATDARKDLRNADFGLVAMSRSIDMFKEMQGQVPAPITRDMPPGSPIAPQVARKAFTMKEKEISEPMKVGPTQWVIIKVEKVIPAKTQSFDEVKTLIQRGLTQQKAQQGGQMMRVSQRLAQLRQQAEINVNIDQYKDAAAFKPQAGPGTPGMPGGAPGGAAPGGAPPAAPPSAGSPPATAPPGGGR